ncbi:glycine cleavage system aminomethyltransferase GcvT [Ferroacidibacillus organovorans]|uniref:Aminomethyltransferase n=1 Tax=Ferroacidibacillus organovorans TaxID=1765683 RepID=A0A1V4EUD8_9BACL|nr:glycine cleavage system aminomethyltransferase GcvT [Ferroacidibacillus organovorans]OPG16450.1 glycine cleavage system protein T [Ferroacidibacillus organovorans]
MTLKRTPLFPLYDRYGGKTVPFGGWDMPVQYRDGILQEHIAVRTRVGLFDVSHMGEFEFSGENAESAINRLITNDVTRLQIGQALYSPVCHENGGTVDDVLVYRLAEDHFMVVVNAANIEKDFNHFRACEPNAVIKDRSNELALLALQGPQAVDFLETVADQSVRSIPYYHFLQNVSVFGISCLVSRTGYTGEDGFELYVHHRDAQALMSAILEQKEYPVIPVGLGARDTLRLEARLPLYGHELGDDISPLEAGLSPFVKLDKETFVGRDALLAEREKGVARKLVGFELTERGIARADCDVFFEGERIGFVTSGTFSPTLQKSIGLALIDARFAEVGRTCEIDVRGKRLQAVFVKTPFYRRPKTIS